MNILKAYADAGALGQQNFSALRVPRNIAAQPASQKAGQKGDSLSLSDEAREMLANGGQGALSVMPQDATYDQHGHVMRQLDSLQGDLRQLAAQFMSTQETLGMLGPLGAMQSRLSSIRAQV